MSLRSRSIIKYFLLLTLVVTGFIGARSVHVLAARDHYSGGGTHTIATCRHDVAEVGRGTLPNGNRYISLQYMASGNDNARRFQDPAWGGVSMEPGWYVDSAQGGCAGPSYYWDGGSVHTDNIYYASLFDGVMAGSRLKDIYLGSPTGATNNPYENYCSIPGIGSHDQSGWRATLGISKCSDGKTWATVNDAGMAQINGTTVYCMGMRGVFSDPICGTTDAARVYDGGGDFAGYLSENNSNATSHLNASASSNYRAALATHTPITGQINSGVFYLRLYGENTRDTVPDSDGWPAACADYAPGTGLCTYPGWQEPLTNNKTSVILTYELEAIPPITVQGFRVYGPSNTHFPAGSACGQVTFDGTYNSSDQPFAFYPGAGNHQMSSSSSITCGGTTYNYEGYTLCDNRIDCHDDPPNTGTIANITTVPGHYYDIYFHYQPVVAISCSLSANPSSLSAGDSSILTWTTSGSPTSASIDNGVGIVSPTSGTYTIPHVNVTTTFTMTVSKSGVNATCNTKISVTSPTPVANPRCSGTTPVVDVSWTGGNPGSAGFYIDIATNSSFSPWLGNYSFGTTRSRTLTTKPDGTSFSTGTTYYIRLYSDAHDPTHSATVSFTMPSTCVQPIGCTLAVDPASSAAGLRTLRWTVSGSPTGASITASYGPNPGSVTPADGSMSWTIGRNTNFTMTVSKAGQTDFQCPAAGTISPDCGNPNIVGKVPNEHTTMTATGGDGTYAWSTPGSSPSFSSISGTGNDTFEVAWSATGNYTVRLSSGGGTADCHVQVSAPPLLPYLRVYGGDVAAGSGFGAGCARTPGSDNGQILGYHPANGAGVELAAFALNTIDGFTSATDRATDPKAPSGLSFSNTSGAPPYYGNFDTAANAVLFCANDYPVPGDATAIASGSNVSGLGAAGQTKSYTLPSGGSPSILQSGQISKGRKIAIYANSDVFIRGNQINYEGADGGTSWASLAEIPSFYLVVKDHNIYIDKSVTRLDGVFIALPNSSGNNGKIYTCTDTSSAPYLFTTSNLNANCNSQLVINGVFMANQVKFQRSFGDVNNGNIAEVFHYGAELWATPPASGSTSSTTYQSITGLPPVL